MLNGEDHLRGGYERFPADGSAIPFSALFKETGEAAGLCTFSNIVRGPFQACPPGYSVTEKFEGKGLMFEILSVAIDYVFNKEGYARSYLRIAGEWEDHILTSLLAEE